MENNNTPAPDRLLKIDEVLSILNISRSHFYAGIRDGTMPKQIKIGGCSRWKASVISAFLGGAQV